MPPSTSVRLRSSLMPGAALAASIVLQTVILALLGLSISPADSLSIVGLAAVVCAVAGAVWVRRRPEPVTPISRWALVSINVWTAASFIAFFLGVALHGATVVFVLETTFAPLAVTLWPARRVGGERRSRTLLWVSMAVSTLGLLITVATGMTSADRLDTLLPAAALGVIAGIAAGRLVVMSRDLYVQGIGTDQIMAHRFYATGLLALAGFVALTRNGSMQPPVLDPGTIAAAAVASVAVPLFLLQYAMQRLPSITVTAGLAAMPTITLAVEWAAGQAVTLAVVLTGLLLIPGVIALLLLQNQQEAGGKAPVDP